MATDAEYIRNELRITCADALELMTDYLDEALVGEDRTRFRAHLGGCEACAVYLDQLRLTVEISGRITGEDRYRVDTDTMSRLLDLYRETRPSEAG